MSWKVWKKSEDRLIEEWEKAISLRNQAKWADAAKHFQKVVSLSEKASGAEYKKKGLIANALACLYLAVSAKTVDNLLQLSNALERLDPESSLDIPNKVKCREIAEEVKVFIAEARLPQVDLNSFEEHPIDAADKFEEVAQSYLVLGRERLVLGDLFSKTDTPYVFAFKYLGFSKFLKGVIEERIDPGKAVEHYAEAIGNFGQAMLEGSKGVIDQRCKQLGNVAKCWFCGRDVQGENVHYVYMNTVLTPYMQKKFSGDSPPSTKDRKIAACVACYKAIYIMADTIAQYYHEIAMARIEYVRDELLAMIVNLESRLNSVERRSHSH